MDPVEKEMSKEEKEKLLNEKIEAMRKRNEEIKKRHEEIENDKKLADKHSASVQIHEAKPYVMKPPRPRPEKIVANSDISSEGDASVSSMNQEYLLSRQRLSQSDGPPPDPSYRFLADPDRDANSENNLKDQDERETLNKKEHPNRGRGRGRGRIDDSQQFANVYAYDQKKNRGRGRGGGGYPEKFRGKGRGGWDNRNNAEKGMWDEGSVDLEDKNKNFGRGSSEHWHDRGRERGGRGRGRGRGRGGWHLTDDDDEHKNMPAPKEHFNKETGRGRGRGRGGWHITDENDEYKNIPAQKEHYNKDAGRGRGRGRGGWHITDEGEEFKNIHAQKDHYNKDAGRGRGRGRGGGWNLTDEDNEFKNIPAQKEHYNKDVEGNSGRGRNMRRGSRGRGQQRAYQQWKAERDAIDEARITRARSGDGEWRREWDMQKIDQETTESEFPADYIYDPRFPRSKGEGFTVADMVSATDLKKLETITSKEKPLDKKSEKGKGSVKDRLYFPNRNQDNWREIERNEKKSLEAKKPPPPHDPNYFENRQEKYQQSKLDESNEDEGKIEDSQIFNTELTVNDESNPYMAGNHATEEIDPLHSSDVKTSEEEINTEMSVSEKYLASSLSSFNYLKDSDISVIADEFVMKGNDESPFMWNTGQEVLESDGEKKGSGEKNIGSPQEVRDKSLNENITNNDAAIFINRELKDNICNEFNMKNIYDNTTINSQNLHTPITSHTNVSHKYNVEIKHDCNESHNPNKIDDKIENDNSDNFIEVKNNTNQKTEIKNEIEGDLIAKNVIENELIKKEEVGRKLIEKKEYENELIKKEDIERELIEKKDIKSELIEEEEDKESKRNENSENEKESRKEENETGVCSKITINDAILFHENNASKIQNKNNSEFLDTLDVQQQESDLLKKDDSELIKNVKVMGLDDVTDLDSYSVENYESNLPSSLKDSVFKENLPVESYETNLSFLKDLPVENNESNLSSSLKDYTVLKDLPAGNSESNTDLRKEISEDEELLVIKYDPLSVTIDNDVSSIESKSPKASDVIEFKNDLKDGVVLNEVDPRYIESKSGTVDCNVELTKDHNSGIVSCIPSSSTDDNNSHSVNLGSEVEMKLDSVESKFMKLDHDLECIENQKELIVSCVSPSVDNNNSGFVTNDNELEINSSYVERKPLGIDHDIAPDLEESIVLCVSTSIAGNNNDSCSVANDNNDINLISSNVENKVIEVYDNIEPTKDRIVSCESPSVLDESDVVEKTSGKDLHPLNLPKTSQEESCTHNLYTKPAFTITETKLDTILSSACNVTNKETSKAIVKNTAKPLTKVSSPTSLKNFKTSPSKSPKIQSKTTTSSTSSKPSTTSKSSLLGAVKTSPKATAASPTKGILQAKSSITATKTVVSPRSKVAPSSPAPKAHSTATTTKSPVKSPTKSSLNTKTTKLS